MSLPGLSILAGAGRSHEGEGHRSRLDLLAGAGAQRYVFYRGSWGGLVSSHKEQGSHQGEWNFGNSWWMKKNMLGAFLRTRADARWVCGLSIGSYPAHSTLFFPDSYGSRVWKSWSWWSPIQAVRTGSGDQRRWHNSADVRITSPAFKGCSSQCYETQQFLLK